LSNKRKITLYLNKAWVITASIFTVVIIAVAVGWVLSQDSSGTESEVSDVPSIPDNSTLPEPESSGNESETSDIPSAPDNSTLPEAEESESSLILWQLDLDHFATGLAVSDGKLFMADHNGDLHCFDSRTGESIWNATVGGTEGHRILVSASQVYVAFHYARVSSFDKDNGTLLWTFQILEDAVFEITPRIALKDDVLFSVTNAIYARDAITGEPLWEANPILEQFDLQYRFYTLSGGFMDGEFLYAVGRDLHMGFSESYANMHYYKINAKLRKVVWRSPLTWDGAVLSWGVRTHSPRVVARTQGRIIIHVIMQGGSLVDELYCLDSTSGKELWSIDVGEVGRPLNPIVYENLFIFAQTDGYIYAVNLVDGSIEWKTKVDTQNFFAINSAFVNSVRTAIQIDARNQRLFWYLNVANSVPPNNYTGMLCNLNISDGNVNWIKHINPGFSSYKYSDAMTFNEETDQIFLPKNHGLWIFNATTSELLQTQEQFEHYILAPLVSGNETFVAADLWLFAYS
jgi:outer membrane protein assembly factor BamB